jgi:hypothetical protein
LSLRAETVDEVLTAFASFVDGEVAATTMALGALRTLAYLVVLAMPPDMQADEALLVGANVPEVGWIPRFDNTAAARSFQEEVAPTGATSRRLTQQLIVAIHTGWEHEYRRRLAAARHLAEPNDVKADFFRDVTRLRNDIVHHHGVATAKNAGKCTTLMRTFKAGDPIYLDDRDLLNIKFQIPWAELVRSQETS